MLVLASASWLPSRVHLDHRVPARGRRGPQGGRIRRCGRWAPMPNPSSGRCGSGESAHTLRRNGRRALRRLRQRPERRANGRHDACGLVGHRRSAGRCRQHGRRILTPGCREQVAAAERPGELGVVFVGQGAGVHNHLNLGDLASQEDQELPLAGRRIERGDRVVDGLDELTLDVLQPAAAGHGHRMSGQDRFSELYFS